MPELPIIAPTVAAIYAAYEGRQDDGLRPHLGASIIGHHCERYIYLSHRWAATKRHAGRMLRLFQTGNLAEQRFVDDLRAIGAEVWEVDPATKRQFRVSALGGHLAGSLDGVVLGIPEAPKTPHVLELKTHNSKSFGELATKGVKQSKPQHFAQMQVYMGLMKLERALYLAVNKDNDELYAERVDYSPEDFGALMARAQRVLGAEAPPARISEDPSWWQCKMCDFHAVCHQGQPTLKTCRSCKSAKPLDQGGWGCTHWEADIPADVLKVGCEAHVYAPGLAGRMLETPAPWAPEPAPAPASNDPAPWEGVWSETTLPKAEAAQQAVLEAPEVSGEDCPEEAPPIPAEAEEAPAAKSSISGRTRRVIARVMKEQPDATPSHVRYEITSQCGTGVAKKIKDTDLAACMVEIALEMEQATP